MVGSRFNPADGEFLEVSVKRGGISTMTLKNVNTSDAHNRLATVSTRINSNKNSA
jgi:hypothetical protein